MLADESGLDLTNPVISSLHVSGCLEGRDPYLSMMKVECWPMSPTIFRFIIYVRCALYANVQLSARGDTAF